VKDVFLHLDKHLDQVATQLGPWLYVLLFAIIFCETGLVVMPLLPGDSLLFAAGAVAAREGAHVQVGPLCLLLCVAAILGDALNYAIGSWVGPRVFTSEKSFFLNKAHLLKTQAFYDRHGGKTILLARFIPIIRTFAPFVAGIGQMSYRRFAAYNVTGGIVWVLSFLLAGWKFGGMELVKRNFHIIIVAIVFISILPPIIEYLRSKREPVPVAPDQPVGS
jgi:membrane-associated protein